MSFGPPEYAASSLRGMDFSWLAADGEGHVAWLVTFGSAVVPPWVDRNAAAYDDVEEALATLSVRGGVSGGDEARYVREWLDVARRGVFGYDWSVYDGPYQLIGRPDHPIHVGELPPALAALALRSRFKHLCFSASPAILARDVEACVEAG
jgi:hypothetical protein